MSESNLTSLLLLESEEIRPVTEPFSTSEPCSSACNLKQILSQTGNLGKFCRYVNSKVSSKTNVGPLRLADGSLAVDLRLKLICCLIILVQSLLLMMASALFFRHACPVLNLRQLYSRS